jgi:hypothetical protein
VEHECISLEQNQPAKRNAFLNRIESSNKNKVPNSSVDKPKTATNSSSTGVAHDNTLKGSAARRKPQQNAVLKTQADVDVQILVCPFCDFLECSGNSSLLEAHVAAHHSFDAPTPTPDLPSTSTSSTTTTNNRAVVDLTGTTGVSRSGSSSDREVCPQCGARFADPIALVGHFETAHGAQQNEGVTTKSDCNIS